MSGTSKGLDRTGVLASLLCAVHCGAAPFLIAAMPALGGIWSHPVSHIAIACVVLPIAALALRRGVRVHHRRSILWAGGVGMALIVAGAVLPLLLGAGWFATDAQAAGLDGSLAGAAEECCDECCPTFVHDEETGERRLNVPLATWTTLAGGVALISAHIANLRCCATCRPAAAS